MKKTEKKKNLKKKKLNKSKMRVKKNKTKMRIKKNKSKMRIKKNNKTLKKMKGGAVPFIPEIGLLFDNMKYFGTGVVNMFSDNPIIVSGNTPHNVPPNPSAQFLRKDTHSAAHVRPNLHNIYKEHYGE
tara:strand:+ start:13131 stop:13514 length:384 start_codon:yes stop_codon:yes gene_type:complete